MKTYKGAGVLLHSFLTSAINGGEQLVSRPDRVSPGEKAPNSHWIGSWVTPRDGLDAMAKRKTTVPAGSRSPSSSLYPSHYTEPQ
jgi:hypothetical protein